MSDREDAKGMLMLVFALTSSCWVKTEQQTFTEHAFELQTPFRRTRGVLEGCIWTGQCLDEFMEKSLIRGG